MATLEMPVTMIGVTLSTDSRFDSDPLSSIFYLRLKDLLVRLCLKQMSSKKRTFRLSLQHLGMC